MLKFLPKGVLNRFTAPAHPYASDVVYKVLFDNKQNLERFEFSI